MLARLGFGKIAFAVSVVAHVGVAVVASQRAHHAAPRATPVVEVAAPDLLPIEPQAAIAQGVSESAEARPESATEARPELAERATSRASFKRSASAGIDSDTEPAPTPSVLTAPAPSAPHFTMLVRASTAVVSGTTAVSGQAPASASSGGAPIAESAAEVRANLRSGVPPAYTPQALAAGIESDVPLELVVGPEGTVQSARALAHVGYGLDEAALRSVQSYRFSPAQRGGHPVAVRMRWVMRFQLQ